MQAVIPNKAARRVPQKFIEAAAEFERSRIDELKKSRKVAWIVASVSTTVCSISTLAFLAALLTRPEPEPTIIQVDRSTGISNVVRSVRDAADKYDDVVNEFWLASYVRMREGYDWFTISEAVDSVKLMSDSNVAAEYDRAVRLPAAPLAMLKDKARVVAKITSIAFVGDVAQVRYTTEKQTMSGENPDNAPVQKWIATIAFKFDAAVMTHQQRLVNPLGFKVLSYRVDPEVIK